MINVKKLIKLSVNNKIQITFIANVYVYGDRKIAICISESFLNFKNSNLKACSMQTNINKHLGLPQIQPAQILRGCGLNYVQLTAIKFPAIKI